MSEDNICITNYKSIALEEAIKHIGGLVQCEKRNGREFICRLMEIQDNSILVFQTKNGVIIRDPLGSIVSMRRVG
jgi:hypothetical protein